jgi:hypothetical protein
VTQDVEPGDVPGTSVSYTALISTVEDTERFLRALIHGQLFDEPATYRSIHERWNLHRLPPALRPRDDAFPNQPSRRP